MPSRLVTHTGGMAAPMDMSDSEGSRGRSTSALSVSRSSLKINKNNLRRPVTQPRPAPQVYKTEPSDFRSLVQQLTGTSPAAESSPILTSKPLNPRLQKIAPPPLRPVFSYPPQQQQQQQQQQPPQQIGFSQSGTFNPGPRRFPSTPQRPSNFAVSPLSFSPLPALSPADQIWANIITPSESPGGVSMRQLSQLMDASKLDLQTSMTQQQPLSLPHTNFPQELSRFSASPSLRVPPSSFNPSFSSFGPAGMPSSGYGGFGGQFSPGASLAMDNAFSFSDADISRSTFS